MVEGQLHLDQLTYKQPLVKEGKATLSLNQAQVEVEAFFNLSDTDTIVFTSSGAEAIAQVYWSVYNHEILTSGLNHMVTSDLEEASILMGMERYNKLGAVTVAAEARGAKLTREVLEPYVTDYTKLISISAVSVQTGVRHDIEAVAELAKEKGILLHLDVSDLIGYAKLDLQHLGADYITIDSERFGGPKGAGLLISKHGRAIEPLILDYQGQCGYRGGFFDQQKFCLLAQSLKQVSAQKTRMMMQMPMLQKNVEAALEKLPGVRVLFKEHKRVAHITALMIDKVFGELLIFYLYQRGIHVHLGGGSLQQTGSFFEKVGIEPFKASHVVTLGWSSSIQKQQLLEAVSILGEEAERIRQMGPKSEEAALC